MSFGILGLVLAGFLSSYLRNQRLAFLEEQSRRIAGIYQQQFTYDGRGHGMMSTTLIWSKMYDELTSEFKSMQSYMNVHFILTDAQLNVEGYSNDIAAISGMQISDEALRRVREGSIVSSEGTLGGFFSVRELTVGAPIIVNDNVVAAAFVSAPMTDLNSTIQDFIRIILAALAAAAAVSFALVYIGSMAISKPIRQVSAAAKEIAAGDFEKRLVVSSRDEVGQLADSFNSMAESLFNQEKARRDFIANISHDLRSPLTAMKGFLQALIDGTIPQEKQQRYIAIILEETERLSRMANDIMDIQKMTLKTALNKQAFDINELIRKTLISLERRIIQKNLEVSVTFADERNMIFADEELVQRIIYNLLDNAVKFLSDGGVLGVETSLAGEKLKIAVRDNGPGITPDEQKRIFERFYKADTARGNIGGSGLGLSIVKEFIKAHDENITVSSAPNMGTEFVFTMPIYITEDICEKEQEHDK